MPHFVDKPHIEMKTQIEIANRSRLSTSALGMILTGQRRPSWRAAKRLESVTGIPAPFWMEASPDELRARLGLPAKRPYRKKTEEVA